MRIKCPHCSKPIEIVEVESTVDTVVCPSCGSKVGEGDQTLVQIRCNLNVLGRFQLIEVLGRGYFGEVWLAEDTDLHRKVAVKIPRTEAMDVESVSRFLREAKAAASLNHPNIVRVHEIGSEDGFAFIVSEFIDGKNLAEAIRNRPFTTQESANLVLTVAEALHHAHETGVIHRDLKPGNILLDRSGKPFLSDFGLAKQESGEITITVAGQILGTPAYMPPEQARGDAHAADRRSDVYSLGVVLYELLAGRKPFQGSLRLLVDAIQNSDLTPPGRYQKSLPHDLETICMKAMAKEPARRYQTAQDFADDLRRYLKGESILARPVSTVEKAWRWGRRHPMAALATAASVLSLSLSAILLWNWNSNSSIAMGVQPVSARLTRVTTIPPGATLKLYPLHPETGEPQQKKAVEPSGVTPLDVELVPGDYFVVAIPSDPDYVFHEVYRRIPSASAGLPGIYRHLRWSIANDGVVEIPEIELPLSSVTQGMALIEGNDAFVLGSETVPGVPPYIHPVADYYMDPHEVSVREIQMLGGNTSFALNMMPQQPPDPLSSVSFVSYDAAVSYAERFGKRLPTEPEYEFAATNRGRQAFPLGDDSTLIENWTTSEQQSPDWDQLNTLPPVFGLYSNLAEWTSSWPVFYPDLQQFGMKPTPLLATERIVRGGSGSVISGNPSGGDWKAGPRMRVKQHVETTTPGLGFRCVRSAKPGGIVKILSD